MFKARKREERRHYKENQNVTKLRDAFNIKNEASWPKRAFLRFCIDFLGV